MSERMQEAALAAAQLLGLVIAGVVLYHLGQPEVGSLVIGAALGHAAPRRRKGDRPSTPPPAALLVLCIAGAAVLSGCGASAVQTSARAATVAAVATQGAARIVTESARADLDAACPLAEYPTQGPALDACAAPVRARWAPADAAVAATRATLVAWVEVLSLAQMAGGDDLLGAMIEAARAFMSAWDDLARALRSVGVEAPQLPDAVRSLLDVTPVPSVHRETDRVPGHTESASDRRHGLASLDPTPRIDDVGLRDLRARASGAAGNGRMDGATLGDLVGYVVGVRPEEQVIGVHARPNVAPMEYVHAIGDGSDVNLVGDPVRHPNPSGAVTATAGVDAAVSGAVDGSSPEPTSAGTDLDLLREPCFDAHVRTSNQVRTTQPGARQRSRAALISIAHRDVLAQLGAELPALPALVTDLAASIGGE